MQHHQVRIGIRDMRASAAAIVRRAESGQRTVITVAGRPVAEIGPITATDRQRGVDELVAQGLLVTPRRKGLPNDAAVAVWGNVRIDRLLREVRG